MASTFTTLLRLEKQGIGENDDTWGSKLNTLADLIEHAIAGRVVITLSSSNVTLTTNNGASDQARYMALAFDGTLSANVNIIVPDKSKVYVVTNNCTGAFTVTVKTNAGTGIVIPQGGAPALLFCDATNVLQIAPALVAYLNVAQNFTKAQAVTPYTLTDAATIALPANESNRFRVVLAGNRTLGNPTGALVGQDFSVLVVQDGTGSRTLAYGSAYRWPGGSAPTLTTNAGRADLLTFSYDSVTGTYLGSSLLNYAL